MHVCKLDLGPNASLVREKSVVREIPLQKLVIKWNLEPLSKERGLAANCKLHRFCGKQNPTAWIPSCS